MVTQAPCTEGPRAGVGLPPWLGPRSWSLRLLRQPLSACLSLPLASTRQCLPALPLIPCPACLPACLLSPLPPLDPPDPPAGSEPPEGLVPPASVPSLSPNAGDWTGVGPGLECAVLRSHHLPPSSSSLSFPTCDTFWEVHPSVIVSDGIARPSTALDVPQQDGLGRGTSADG